MTIEAMPATTCRWARATGLQELGQAQGSGLREPTYLVQRADGQVLQLSALLHLVISAISADRSTQQIAEAVGEACGRELPPDALHRLLTGKLQPLGLVENLEEDAGTTPAVLGRAAPLLSLRLRRTLLPAATVRTLARPLAALFHPAVVAGALCCFVGMDLLLIRPGTLSAALTQVWLTPTVLLALFAILSISGLVHELGHAAACHYGGARPGVIGVGVYLVFPAFFTNVTDSYRLSRAGRVRTDLGGLYFNVWCLLALGSGYLLTGQPLLLLAAVLMQVEMVQQLIPTVRFDGYFVLADLAGVPDLFARLRPLLTSLLPWRSTDRRVAELRPAARRIVTGWVLVVVPTLAAGFGWLLINLPSLARRSAGAISDQVRSAAAAWSAHDVPALLVALLSVLLVALPLAGLLIFGYRLGELSLHTIGRAMTVVHTRPADQPASSEPEPRTVAGTVAAGPGDPLTAADFTDDVVLLPRRGRQPTMGWRRAVFAATGGAVNPGPSPAEVHRDAVLARITAPITGSRRVVVMSRKGGVGKTTVTLTLGSTFAMLRGDRVVAVDANPDAGNLAHRVAKPCGRTISDVLAVLDSIGSYAELREFTAQAPESRLEVIASDDDPRIGSGLGREDYHRVIELLDHYYNLILLDTGTGILDSANQGLLTEADQLVLVLRPALDGARAAAQTLDWLAEHGYRDFVSDAVVVINASRGDSAVSLARIEEHFAQRCAQVVSVPWDRALEAGAQTSLADLQPATRDALIGLAAAVADRFVAQNPTPKVRTSGGSPS